jgi:flavodoxin
MKKTGKRKGWKRMLVVFAGIILLIGAAVAGGLSLMKHEYGDRMEILKSASETPQRALVVYQPSVTAASSDVAHAIAKGLNDAGYEVTLNTPGKHLSADISGYSVVVFGSPNYGGSPGEALLNYLKQIDDFTGKRILLYSTSGRAAGRLEFDKLEALLQGVEPYQTLKLAAGETEKNKAAAYQLGLDAAGQ